ncbi:hypothetical protein NVV95_08305 [Herbiconiux sp. CPCC 205716]|uniref:Uncharacterized protein n=1 Tax=Herbiconiux gentiana TaxID=2970912 RepID=A0ABT2GEB0_9MICO|nr:hypothetical protein [Herbiconiux gentiana]MCS5714553.1 hypothetical protein [Herbiconiux gentiana]
MKVGNRYLIAGAALIVLSAVVTVTLPALAYAMLDANTSGGQEYLVAVELGVRVLENIAAPLGTALLAVGLILNRPAPRCPPDPDRTPRETG